MGRKLAQNKTAEKPQGVTARKLPKGNRSQQRLKSLGAETGNRQSPTTAMPATRIAVPGTRQGGTPPYQGQKAESLPRDTKPLPLFRAHHMF